MQVFSKRYPEHSIRRLSASLGQESTKNFISSSLRTRLLEEVKFLISSGDFLERCLIVDDLEKDTYFLHPDTIKNIFEREVGYDISNFFNTRVLEFATSDNPDAYFFDLIELMIVFSNESKRDEIISRIKNIFIEENAPFTINSFMIVLTKETGLRALVPILKDNLLKNKLEELYEALNSGKNYQISARLAADVVQYLFSSDDKSKTKSFATDLCTEIASKWTNGPNVDILASLINDNVKNAKALNNQIANIRHTDRHTIPVEGSIFFKLVTYEDLSIVELVIQSLPETFITNKDPEELKSDYFVRYKVQTDVKWTYKKKEEAKVEDDIPF